MDEREYTLVEHLTDLRKCLFRAVLGIFVATFACFSFSDRFILWLRKPMAEVLGEGARFVVLAPHEYFFVQLNIALWPVFYFLTLVVLSFWLFVAPGLRSKN